MQKREAQFQTKFNSFLRNKFQQTAVFELKVATKNYLPIKSVLEHQINSLLACSNGTLAYKISDQSIGYKPFDCFCITNRPAYVVIQYPSKKFYMIEINDFVKEKESIYEDRAKKIATFSSDDFL